MHKRGIPIVYEVGLYNRKHCLKAQGLRLQIFVPDMNELCFWDTQHETPSHAKVGLLSPCMMFSKNERMPVKT